ncbi:MAG: hydantoinase/oxoprolinase family protein, partial [Candidatus Heimdallarchaeota archaeon]|nr:hydantoinase/oxoprolinase family protein [Candidatus Heimdallarchaeota archaeon]
GGTSTDVASIIKGKAGIQQEQKLGGLPVAVPAVDIVTIGAGGGSLVQIRSGLIQVGPESAGADPGPIAYDQGGSVLTITDIDLCFGLLSNQLAGGLMVLKPILAEDAAEKMASELQLTLNDFVSGVRKIFHENIASALKSVSLERGQDPRKFSLLAFGGAGPAHAVEIAELMQISKVIIPPYPGAWSAIGLIGADYSYSNSKGVVRNLDHFKLTELQSEYAKLAQVLQTEADQDRQPHFRILQKFILMRFKGQSYELTVDFEEDIQKIRQQFLDLHVERYGFAAKDEEIEVVSLRVNLLVPHENPKLPKMQDHSKIQPFESRNIIGEHRSIPVYRKLDFASDTKFEGPLLIDQLDTTIWVPRGWNLITNEYGFLILKKQAN